MSTARRVVLVSLVCLLTLTPVSVSGVTAADPTDGDIVVTYTVSSTTDAAGQVELTATFPEQVVEFEVALVPAVEVTGADGFSQEGDRYVWDGETENPTLTYEVPTSAALFVTERYAEFSRNYVEAGFGWRYRGDAPDLTRETRVAGDGTVHGFSVALWEEAYTATSADGTEISVVVPPDAGPGAVDVSDADLRALRDEFVAVDEFFGFDRRDDHLVVLVRPTDSAGLAGDVVGSASNGGRVLLEPAVVADREVLAHEYIHTQQDFATTRELDWFLEGSAEYYGHYYAYHTGDLRFAEFHDRITVGSRYADTDLRSLTNASEPADYEKGGHVAAGLDTELRSRTDGRASLQDVLVAMRAADGGDGRYADGEAISESAFRALLERAAGSSLASYLDAAVGDAPPPNLPRDRSRYAHDGAAMPTPTPTPTVSPTPSPTVVPSTLTPASPTLTPTVTPTRTATPTLGTPTSPEAERTATTGQPLPTALLGVALTIVVWLGLRPRR